MNRLNLFSDALGKAREAYAKAPYMFPLESVIKQLEYLVSLETGMTVDRTKLESIIVGDIAARDIDTFDAELGETLHAVSAEVRQMRSM